MGFVEDDQAPLAPESLLANLIVARELVETSDQLRMVLERIARCGDQVEGWVVNLESKSELVFKLHAPLFYERAWRNDEDALCICTQ
ncbi:hypothetical protein D3C87_1648490 [compost metagenome]